VVELMLWGLRWFGRGFGQQLAGRALDLQKQLQGLDVHSGEEVVQLDL
jgi:hypothetical protein